MPIGNALFGVAVVCLMSQQGLGQQPLPPRPELANIVYIFQSSEDTLKPLPAQKAKAIEKSGLTRSRTLFRVPGRVSSFRLKNGSELVFAVRCSDPDAFKLYAFTIKGNTREAVTVGAKAWTRSGPALEPPYDLKFSLTEYGDTSYKIVVKSLKPGEYAFAVGMALEKKHRAQLNDYQVFDFAVDAQ